MAPRLATLVEAHVEKYFPIDLPDPVEAIKFRMKQAGLSPKDTVPAVGRLNRVYEILNHKRPLTPGMILKLREKFSIPAESLIHPPTVPMAAISGRGTDEHPEAGGPAERGLPC